jgi:hypothetical protein
MTRLLTRLSVALAATPLLLMAPVATTAAGASPTPAAAHAAAAGTGSAAAAVRAAERNPKVSRSLYGIRSSAYIGRYYRARHEARRKCIVRRESGGNYRIVSRNGTYRGAYQFNPSLARQTARRMGRGDLAGRPMNTWSRFDQDKAFWIVWNNGRGAGHWGHAC